ncbi:MAG TPA: shikimate kinase, partial [Syntrophales bacterium]|nr:shikimate kinase [Syntrophales bacterium]
MHIVLIGYRGSGKSAVGKRLAERLRMPFYDTDDLVEKRAGRSIQAIVEERGWPYFRRIEHDVIREFTVL